MSSTTEIKDSATEIVDLLRQLPKERQDYVNGYVQGIADSNKDNQNEHKNAS